MRNRKSQKKRCKTTLLEGADAKIKKAELSKIKGMNAGWNPEDRKPKCGKLDRF